MEADERDNGVRIVITIDQDGTQGPNGPILVGPRGVIVFTDAKVAGEAANAIVKGGTAKGAFLQQLRPVALYVGVGEGEVAVLDDGVTEVSRVAN